MTLVNSPPNEFMRGKRCVVWKSEERNGKLTKVPYSPLTGFPTDVTIFDGCSNYAQAYRVYSESNGKYDGIGFVLGAGIAGIDLDKCIENNTVQPWAMHIVKQINSYTEKSPSRSGLHILLKADNLPGDRRRTAGIEIYINNRYFTLTGDHLSSTPFSIEKRQRELNALYHTLFAARTPEAIGITPQAVSHDGLTINEQWIIKKALESKHGEAFRLLLEGNWEEYGEKYILSKNPNSHWSQSEAHYHLAQRFAFWTNKDPQAIERLISHFPLGKADKWFDRPDYREKTIARAIAATTEGFTPRVVALSLADLAGRYEDKISFVWRQHLPKALPIILAGREGIGKTTIALQIAKEQLSQYPNYRVLWFATEGHLADTYEKAIELDLPDGFIIASKGRDEYIFDFGRRIDLERLDELLTEYKPIISTWIDSIRGMSAHGENDPLLGKVMTKINAIACDKHRVHLTYLDHESKGQKKRMLDRVTGTTAKTSQVRRVYQVYHTAQNIRRIVCTKNNILGSPDPPPLRSLKRGSEILLYPEVDKRPLTEKERAADFLVQLFEKKKTYPTTEIKEMAEKQNIQWATVEKTKKQFPIQSEKPSGQQYSGWHWTWEIEGQDGQ